MPRTTLRPYRLEVNSGRLLMNHLERQFRSGEILCDIGTMFRNWGSNLYQEVHCLQGSAILGKSNAIRSQPESLRLSSQR